MSAILMRLGPVMGIVLVVLSACTTGVNDASQNTSVNGSFELIRYNGSALPADLGPIGPRTGNEPQVCHAHVTLGNLALRATTMAFEYQYDVRNSCDQRLLSNPRGWGSYSQDGTTLRFTLQAQDTAISFTGQVHPDRITLQQPDLMLEFRR